MRFIDANHCPGAVMVHIDGPYGHVLHTGDFRYNGERMLRELGDYHFDYLYLDNTFASPAEDFPPQRESYLKLRGMIEKVRKEDSAAKFFIYCYTLGKEEVFINLARYFQTKIMSLKDRWNKLEVLGVSDDYFTHRDL